jgi:ABC-2 type transport system ATP-binding protein
VLVETHGLTKTYGGFTALRDFTFGVERGEVFGLLGPNGAGKTTLLRLLLGFLKPTSGKATVAELDCHRDSVAVHRLLAYLPGDARLFRRLNGRDTLKFFAEIRPGGDLTRSLAIAERLELDTRRRVASMSTGMRQKVALAATMAADVQLVILDEPTSNLDPTMRSVVSKLVREAQQAGRTVIFSSHVMSEVEEVCDRVVIVRRGELVHTQVMKELRAKHLIRAQLRGELPAPPSEFRDQLTILPSTNGDLTIETPGSIAPLLGWLATLPLEDLQIERAGLQQIYDRFHSPM